MDVPQPILNSKYRKEIDDMLTQGDTYTAISKWLANNGERITRQTISQYHKFCFNINKVAAEVYKESQDASDERLHKAAVEQSMTLKMYDKFIEMGNEIDPSMLDDRTKADIAIKAAKQREDFMREHGDSAMEEMAATIDELRAEIRDMNLLDLVRGISDDRTSKRIKKEDNP